MGLRDEMRAAFVEAMAGDFADNAVTWRHIKAGRDYTGLRAVLQSGEDLSHRGVLSTASGGIRQNVADLKEPFPKLGDEIQLPEQNADRQVTRSITALRYDQIGAMVMIEYGAQYA